ncbi:MAG: hypothetical protein EON58_02200 [Alphaproteobacteria bacterium]|nr:MAG: hypothetical protein EON58_02200 [Alphaproteobacteria bacterium]
MISRKNLKAFIKVLDGASEGTVEAIVNTFEVIDSYNERVKPGAFVESLAEKLPKFVWGHDWQRPIGKVLEAREALPGDPILNNPDLPEAVRRFGGLYIKAEFRLTTTSGRDAHEHIKAGDFDEYSIGYEVEADRVGEDGVRDLIKIRLYECSPVMVGANPATVTLAVKSLSDGHEAEQLCGFIRQWVQRDGGVKNIREKLTEAQIASLKSAIGSLDDLFIPAVSLDAQRDLDAEAKAAHFRNLARNWA